MSEIKCCNKCKLELSWVEIIEEFDECWDCHLKDKVPDEKTQREIYLAGIKKYNKWASYLNKLSEILEE